MHILGILSILPKIMSRISTYLYDIFNGCDGVWNKIDDLGIFGKNANCQGLTRKTHIFYIYRCYAL